MQRMFLVAVSLSLTLAWFASAQIRGVRYAFLVGCEGYNPAQLKPLPYSVNDVEKFKKALIESGFDETFITMLHDKCERRFQPEGAKILAELKALLADMKPADEVVVALSGHGVHFKGDKTGYFCPIDARLNNKTSLIAMDGPGGVFDLLKGCKAGRKLLIVNACRNDPAADVALAANKVNLDDDDTDIVPEGIAALYSCKPGQKSYYDPKREHGIFFDHVIRAWKGEYLKADQEPTLEAFFDQVTARTRVDVRRSLEEDQVPVVRREYSGATPWLTRAGKSNPVTPKPPEPTETVKDPVRLKAPFDQATALKARKEWAAWLKVPETRSLDLGSGVKMEFVLIPPGTFLMGSPEGEKDREPFEKGSEKQHEVTITKAFYLSVTETTQKQYAAVIAGAGGNPSHFKGDDLPVESVSWEEAKAFCGKISKEGAKVDLPTEAQWEYACRAGTTTPFHFGGVLKGDLANCDGEVPYGTETKGPYLEKTTPVGTKEYPANAFGLRDMHGNVWEWCSDAYRKDYETLGANNPRNDGKPNDSRVVRGGSWYNYSEYCRAAIRNFSAPGNRVSYSGFRCVLLLP